MPKIVIGKSGRTDVSFDLELLLRTRLLVQANSGGGKSFLLRRLAEQLFGKVQVLLIDREGEFASLREKFGYVLIGQGGDAPADIRSARLLAEKLLELRASTVFDLYEAFRSRPGDRRAWVRAFLEGLVDAPKSLWHDVVVIVDESHQFCPQEVPKAASMAEREIISGCKDAMISLATIGRKRGLCAIWATQRLAKLDKDASAELFNRLVGMTVEDVDVDRAVDLMSVSRDEKPEFKKRLRDLEPGNFFAFGRAISKERILVKVGGVVTTHPEPGFQKHGNEPPPPPEKVKALLPKLQDLPKEVETRAKTEAELRQEIRSLKASIVASEKFRELRNRIDKPLPQFKPLKETVRVEVPVIPAAQLVRLERAMAAADRAAGRTQDTLGALRGFSDLIRENVRKIELAAKRPEPPRGPLAIQHAMVREHPPATPFHRKATPTLKSGNGEAQKMDKCARAILIVLSQYPEGCSLGKIALLAGYKKSGTFMSTLSSLRTSGFMEGQNSGTMKITDGGQVALGSYEPLPQGNGLATYWLSHPSFEKCERQILKTLLDNPEGLLVAEICENTGYAPSGAFMSSLSSLRTAGVLVGRNSEKMKASGDLF